LSLLLAMLGLAPVCSAQKSNTSFSSLPNDTTTGTALNFLAKKQPGGAGGRAKLVVATSSDTNIPLFVVNANAGTALSAVYVLSGEAPCVFDSTTTGKGGSAVVVGIGGRCHQTDTVPSPGFVVGTLTDDSTTNGQTSMVDFWNTQYSAPPGAGSGTVTSLQVTMPINEFTVSPTTAITTSGVFAVSKANVNANCVMAGPVSGGPAAWTCRNLQLADIPTGSGGPPSGAAGGDLGSSYPNPTVVKASGQFAFPGRLAVTLSSATTNDWNPTGPPAFGAVTILGITCGVTSCRITGLASGGLSDGTIKNMCNVGPTSPVVLGTLDSGSAAANQFDLTDDVTIAPKLCKTVWYDATATKWKLWDGTPEDYLKLRPFSLFVGDPESSSPPLLDGNDSPTVWTNMYRRPLKILALACKVDVQGATPLTIQPILTGQSATSVVTGPCTCGNGSFATCTLTGQPILQPVTPGSAGANCPTAPCSLDFNIATAGGTAKVVIGNFEAILQ